MSTTSASRNITYVRKSGTYTTTIMSPSGDLWQEYKMNGTAMTVTPDFATTKPILEMVVVSSRTDQGRLSVASNQIKWYFNDTEITFDSSTNKDTNFGGVFLKTSTTVDSKTVQRLQITGNLVTLAGKSSCIIKAVVAIIEGTVTDNVQATYTIPIQQSSGNSYRVTIVAGDTKNFVIDEEGGSCTLKAMTYFDGTIGNASYTYQWYKLNGTSWQAVSGGTSQTLTVKGSDIDTYAEYKVEVSLNGSIIGSDVQGVMDTTDPYMINANPDKNNEVIYESWGDTEGITYKPTLVTRSGGTTSLNPTFSYVAMDSYGVITGSSASGTKYTVTRAMCNQAGGDVTLVITATF